MKYHDIYFDKTNRMLGFIESDCLRSGSTSPIQRPPKICAGSQKSNQKFTTVLIDTQIQENRDILIAAGLFIGSATLFYSVLRYRRYRIRRSSGPKIPLSRVNGTGGITMVNADNLSINKQIPMAADAKTIKSQVSTLNYLNEPSMHPPKGRIKRNQDDKSTDHHIVASSKSTLDPDYNYQISEDDDDHLGQVNAYYDDIKQEVHTGQDDSLHAIGNQAKAISLNSSAADKQQIRL